MKKNLLKRSGIYLVTDKKALKGKDVVSIITTSLKAGIDIIQFRDKEASDKEFLETGRKIKDLARKKKALFIVDDRVDLALALDSDGVHLGQDDMPVEIARKILGRKKIIGLSTHSIPQIRKAAKEKVDYISVGPVFSTPTKPDYKEVGLKLIRFAKKEVKIPFVAIGGINESNIRSVVLAGAGRVAIVRAILSKKDSYKAMKNLIKLNKKYDTIKTCKTE